jgi:hypothetical protein
LSKLKHLSLTQIILNFSLSLSKLKLKKTQMKNLFFKKLKLKLKSELKF